MGKTSRTVVLIFAFVLLLNFCGAIRINEVEMNPKDDCNDCTEWAELYSEEEVNLSEYQLENNKSKIINLSGIKSGYIAIDFGKQFLTNKGDRLILKKNDTIIDEIFLEDEENNDLTYQFCSSSWKFMSSTKGQENNCTEQPPEENETINETYEEETTENYSTTPNIADSSTPKSTSGGKISTPKSTTKAITLEMIDLNSKDIKSEDNKEILKKNLALGGIVTFCIGFGALFLLRLTRKKENEFRG